MQAITGHIQMLTTDLKFKLISKLCNKIKIVIELVSTDQLLF